MYSLLRRHLSHLPGLSHTKGSETPYFRGTLIAWGKYRQLVKIQCLLMKFSLRHPSSLQSLRRHSSLLSLRCCSSLSSLRCHSSLASLRRQFSAISQTPQVSANSPQAQLGSVSSPQAPAGHASSSPSSVHVSVGYQTYKLLHTYSKHWNVHIPLPLESQGIPQSSMGDKYGPDGQRMDWTRHVRQKRWTEVSQELVAPSSSTRAD